MGGPNSRGYLQLLCHFVQEFNRENLHLASILFFAIFIYLINESNFILVISNFGNVRQITDRVIADRLIANS